MKTSLMCINCTQRGKYENQLNVYKSYIEEKNMKTSLMIVY